MLQTSIHACSVVTVQNLDQMKRHLQIFLCKPLDHNEPIR